MRAERNGLFGERRGERQPARLRLPLTRVISPPIRSHGGGFGDRQIHKSPARWVSVPTAASPG